MCRHGRERMVSVWVLNDKGKKELAYFSVDGYEPDTNTVYQFPVSWMSLVWGYMSKESYKKTTKEI